MFASAVQRETSVVGAALMIPPDGGAEPEAFGRAPARRITADTFKALQDKLKAKKQARLAIVPLPPPAEPVVAQAIETGPLPPPPTPELPPEPAPALEAIAPDPPAPPPPATMEADAWEVLARIAETDAAAEPPAAAPEAEVAPEPVIAAEIESAAEPPKADWENLIGSLGEKFGTSVASILHDAQAADDPFHGFAVAAPEPAGAETQPAEALVGDAQAIEIVRALLDVMSAGAVNAQPQERTLAADTLLRLIPRLPEKSLVTLAERVAIMDQPPAMLVTALIRDPRLDVSGPLIEKASNIPEADLLALIEENFGPKQKVIARRRHLSPALTHALIETMDQSVLLTILRNQGAEIAHEDFHRFASLARLMPPLQAPLVTRANTPAPVAFELFWNLPPELRRFVLSRFLTDSETLNRILKIANTVGAGEAADEMQPGHRFPEKAQVEEVIAAIVEGNLTKAGQLLSKAGGICETTAQRVICDRDGEPLAVLMKAMGISRQHFGEILGLLQSAEQSMLNKQRNPLELQTIFDQLSFNKARMLLTYWDWSALQTGPYARNAA